MKAEIMANRDTVDTAACFCLCFNRKRK